MILKRLPFSLSHPLPHRHAAKRGLSIHCFPTSIPSKAVLIIALMGAGLKIDGRIGLTMEPGLNDDRALPFAYLAIAIAISEPSTTSPMPADRRLSMMRTGDGPPDSTDLHRRPRDSCQTDSAQLSRRLLPSTMLCASTFVSGWSSGSRPGLGSGSCSGSTGGRSG